MVEQERIKEGWATTPATRYSHYWSIDGLIARSYCGSWTVLSYKLWFQGVDHGSEGDCPRCWSIYYLRMDQSYAV